MFENTVAYKRMLKKEKMTKALEEAKKSGNLWKVKQIESKLACFEKRYYPKKIWDSSLGACRK